MLAEYQKQLQRVYPCPKLVVQALISIMEIQCNPKHMSDCLKIREGDDTLYGGHVYCNEGPATWFGLGHSGDGRPGAKWIMQHIHFNTSQMKEVFYLLSLYGEIC